MSDGAAPQPINFGGIGDIDMYPDPTFQAIQKIFRAGSAFGGVWPGLLAAVNTDEQAVSTGFDDLSVAFRNAYNQYKPVVEQRADRVMPQLHDAAEKGNAIVAHYLELTEQIQPAYMRSLM